MAFQEVADLDCSTTTALGGTDKKSGKKNPTSIEGYYVGTRQVVSPKSKTGFAALHVFQTKTGNVGVWGKTNLDAKMLTVKPGAMARVEFTGMVETKNNPMYKYRVQVDLDNVIDVASADNSIQGDSDTDSFVDNDGGEYGAGASESDIGTEEAPLDEPPVTRATRPATPAATPSAQRIAEVQARLNGRGAKRA